MMTKTLFSVASRGTAATPPAARGNARPPARREPTRPASPGGTAATPSTRSGATLLVTLGVMTVLSVMVVTFLLTVRYQRLSAQHYRDKTVARQVLETALLRAMQYADHAMLASNYVSQASAPLNPNQQLLRRVYPVGTWYSRDYQPDPANPITDEVVYQTQEALMVPVIEEPGATSFATNALTVNLLTAEVRRLLPPVLTNRLDFDDGKLRCGWINLGTGSRVAFAVINCSGLIDAHTYDFENACLRPATQSYARTYYNQQDLINDRGGSATTLDKREELSHMATLSYDPAPYTTPFASHSSSVHPQLGYRDFSSTNKFNLNTLTNFFDKASSRDCARIRVTQAFESKWLNAVSNTINDAQRNAAGVVLGDTGKVAWNIAAYMTPSRVPQVSFPGIALGSRADYGIESVPLINEVAVLNCIDESGNYDKDIFGEAISQITTELQERFTRELEVQFPGGKVSLATPIVVSNIYAAAAELWYPFAPRPVHDENRPDESVRLYLGVYTNKGEVVTTVNKNWSAGDLADWYNLDDPTVAELEANILNDDYENDTGAFTNTLFWALVETNDLVVTVIQEPAALNSTNLFDFSTGLANGYVGVYTDFATGLIETNNPYRTLLYSYAPASTNLTPEEAELYYVTASNYIPVLVTVLTSRVEQVTWFDGGDYAFGSQSAIQRYLPPTKVQVGPFGNMWHPAAPLANEDFNEQGFCAITNNEKLVCFPVLQKSESEETYRVAFLPLGNNCKAWVRPVVAIKEPGNFGLAENDGYEAVDEALLVRENASGGGETIGVMEWPPADAVPATATDARVVARSVADPRDNAWGTASASVPGAWYTAPSTFGTVNKRSADDLDAAAPVAGEEAGYSDAIPGVAELPFIHADAPLRSVGELGYVTADLAVKKQNRDRHAPDRSGKPVVRDTIDFSTAAGASLLDRFTTAPTNGPMRGLVQANTPYAYVIRKLIEDTPYGWTNWNYQTEHIFELSEGQGLEEVTEDWTNTLFRVYDPSWDRERSGLPGWRCFADMLPDLATNATRHAQEKLAAQDNATFYRHDYVEDVLRGFVDKVSFRQNIYVVVIAAQALSPASTDANPIVLADQRAAVTVIRDAYTGRWMIYNWVWLKE